MKIDLNNCARFRINLLWLINESFLVCKHHAVEMSGMCSEQRTMQVMRACKGWWNEEKNSFLPFVEFSTTSLPSVHVTSPTVDVVGISTFCSIFSVITPNGLTVVASLAVEEEDEVLVDVLVDSVIGFLLDAADVLGRFVVLRVTNVDLTVELLVIGLDVVNEGFSLNFSSDSTENVVTSMSSADSVVGSTLTM